MSDRISGITIVWNLIENGDFFFISFKESFVKGCEGKYRCELIKEFNTNIFKDIQSFKARIYKIDNERDWNGFAFSILIGKTFRGFAFPEDLIHLVRVNRDLLIKIVMMHYNDKYMRDYNFIIDKIF